MERKRARPWKQIGALTLLAAAAVAWQLLAPLLRPPATLPVDAPARDGEVVELAEIDSRALAAEQAPGASPAETELRVDRRAAAGSEPFDFATAIHLAGRVAFPPGTPPGEIVEVVAKQRGAPRQAGFRARVGERGEFSVAFPEGTKRGTVEIDAPHLFLAAPIQVSLDAPGAPEELLVEPLLGGCIQVRFLLPAGAPELARELAGKSVASSGQASDQAPARLVTALIDADARCELRGLWPDQLQRLAFESEVVATLTTRLDPVSAGSTSIHELQLQLGVSLRGRVVDAHGAPPSALDLQVGSYDPSTGRELAETRHVATAADGRFLARGVAPGKLVLTAAAKGRMPAKLELGILRDGDVREDIEVVLGLGHQIGGRAVRSDGSPLAGVEIDLALVRYSTPATDPDSPRVPRKQRTTTGANGEFLVSGLAHGNYNLAAKVVVTPPPGLPPWKQPAVGCELKLGAVPADTLDVRLTMIGDARIRGLALDDVGAPIGWVDVVAFAPETGQELAAKETSIRTDAGRFELLGLVEGEYTVRVSARGYDDAVLKGVAAAMSADEQTYELRRRANVSGVVLRPDGTPASRARVTVESKDGHDVESLSDTTTSKGEFRIGNLRAGAYRARARASGFASSEGGEFEVASAQGFTNLVLVLRSAGRIAGEVHEFVPEESGAQRQIYLRYGGNLIQERFGKVDADGRFAFESLEPGEYGLELHPSKGEARRFKEVSGVIWAAEELLTKRQTVEVACGETVHVVFGVPTRGGVAISGRLRGDREPHDPLFVRARSIDDAKDQDLRYTICDLDGRFALEVNGPGTYQLQSMYHDAGARVGRTFEVPAEGLHGIELERPKGRIAGTVRLVDGQLRTRVPARLDYIGGSLRPEDVEPRQHMGNSSRFEFRDLPSGKYLLQVNVEAREGPNYGRVYDQHGTVKRELELGEGEQLIDLVVELPRAQR